MSAIPFATASAVCATEVFRGELTSSPAACRVAGSPGEVLDAWHLVYQVYRRVGFIDANPLQLHLVHEAMSPRSAVFAGYRDGSLSGTLTGIVDDGQGLPLDEVAQPGIDRLRKGGRSVIEIGLFAEATQEDIRGTSVLLGLLGLVFAYGCSIGLDDFVIGVHPRRAALYRRAFGFEPMGRETTYPRVRHQPVVPMRAQVAEALDNPAAYPGIARFLRNQPHADMLRPMVRLDHLPILSPVVSAVTAN